MEHIVSDLNNNSKKYRGKSYSLRPRALNKKDDGNDDFIVENIFKTKNKTKKKLKQKPAPLSKYRRKNANARERHRMKEINDAFETLRKAIPSIHFVEEESNSNNEKMTKITTLKLAMKYISILNHTLKDTPTTDSENDAESLTSSDYTWTTTPDNVPFSSLTSLSDHEQSLTSDFLFSDSSTTDNFTEFPLTYTEYDYDFGCNEDHDVSSFLFDTDLS